MRVHVSHSIGDLFRDLKTIQSQVRPDARKAVLKSIRSGNNDAKRLARGHNPPGSHSYKYPGTFSAEMGKDFYGFGAGIISGEYGPRPSGQGLLAPILENGSRNGNAPQQNLARSADLAGETLRHNIHVLPPTWFWPGGDR